MDARLLVAETPLRNTNRWEHYPRLAGQLEGQKLKGTVLQHLVLWALRAC